MQHTITFRVTRLLEIELILNTVLLVFELHPLLCSFLLGSAESDLRL